MATYYVKQDGGTGDGLSDTNAWSPAFFDSQQASGLAVSDTVLFKRDGEYPIKITTARASLTYGAYDTGEKPNITGYQSLTSWTLHSGNIYYATLDMPFLNNVKLDGVLRGKGRYPNTGYLQYTSHTDNTSITGTDVGTIPFDPAGAEVVIRKQRWILDRHPVTSRSGDTLNYGLSSEDSQNNNDYEPQDLNGFFIQNTVNALSLEGDWYYDIAADRLYMHFGAGTPSGREVQASVRDRNIEIIGYDGITVNDLSFEGGNVNGAWINTANSPIFNNCDFKNQGENAFFSQNTNGLQINGGSVITSLNNGINLFAGTVNGSVSGVVVDDIHSIAGAGRSGDGNGMGIGVEGDGLTVTDCTVTNMGYLGISFMGDNVLVEDNFMDTYCTVKDDGAGIYTYNPEGTGGARVNRTVNNNTVLNGIGAFHGAEYMWWMAYGAACGIYLDGDSNNVSVTGNDVQIAPWCGLFSHDSDVNITISGNRIKGCPAQVIFVSYTAGYMRNLVFSGNILTSESGQICFQYNMNVEESPALVGTFSNNRYNNSASPVTLRIKIEGGSETSMTLREWKNLYGIDLDSLSNAIPYKKSGNLVKKSGKIMVKSD